MATGRTNASASTGGGGGLDINGVIERYKVAAGMNINAGDFVRFVNMPVPDGWTSTQLMPGTAVGTASSAVLLPNGNVFIAHPVGVLLYGMIVKIDGASINPVSDTQLSALTQSGRTFSAVLLQNGDVFIAHSGSNATRGMVVSVNEEMVTVKADVQLHTTISYQISALRLLDGNVFVVFGNTTSSAFSIVVSVEDANITFGTVKALGSNACSIDTALMPNGNVFVVHGCGNNLRGIVSIINGTAITTGIDTLLLSGTNAGATVSAVALSDEKIFVLHRVNASQLGCMIVTINDTIENNTVIPGAVTQLSALGGSSNVVDAILLPDGDVLIAHTYDGSKNNLAVMVVSIDGDTAIPGADAQITPAINVGATINALLLQGGELFVVGGFDVNLYATISFGVDEFAIPAPSGARAVNGVSKTAGSGGDTIDVYAPI